jgi:hypothetical protein
MRHRPRIPHSETYQSEKVTMANNYRPDVLLAEKLDKVISLLQNSILLEGAKAGIKKEQLRKLLGIDMNRITRAWKYIRPPKK